MAENGRECVDVTYTVAICHTCIRVYMKKYKIHNETGKTLAHTHTQMNRESKEEEGKRAHNMPIDTANKFFNNILDQCDSN